MTTARNIDRPARRKAAAGHLAAPRLADVERLLADRNPGAPRAAVLAAAQVMAVATEAVTALSPGDQGRIIDHGPEAVKHLVWALRQVIVPKAAEAIDPQDRDHERDDEIGEGLGAALSPADGNRRLDAYATPMPIAAWAGEVAGPTELQRRFGISRSTLHDWQRRHAVVGLRAGTRRHVYPLAQFVDGRPIEGLGEVVGAAGSTRTAWLWLLEPHPSLKGGAPLARLRQGEAAEVADLAARDFGQP
jgi:hypothetical protein